MRQFWALIKLAWRRELNTFYRPTSKVLKRRGTAAKRGLGCLGGLLFVWVHLWMGLIFFQAARGFAQSAPGELVFLLALLQLTGVLMEVSSQNLNGVDWDVEWLVTLPISRPTLLFLRALQRAVTGNVARTVLYPAAVALAVQQGWRWAALPLGLLAVFPIALMQASLGLAAEFAARGVAVNALWPRTVIATAALAMIPGVSLDGCRRPEIVADAAHAILMRPAREATGRFLIDEDVLRNAGVGDFSSYAVDPARPLLPDLFLD